MKGKPTLAIDFDGVIMKNTSSNSYQDPMPNTAVVLKELYKDFEIVVFTARLYPEEGKNIPAIKKQMETWFKKNDIPYDEITNSKPKAVAYIDDRAIRFTNWGDIKNYFVI